MLDRPGFEFSFSGLKTAVSQAVRNAAAQAAQAEPATHDWRADLALAVQTAIVDTLCIKAIRALQFTGHKTLVVAGGVGANLALRERIAAEAQRIGARVYFPRLAFCTDNAAMIAMAGLLRLQAGEHTQLAVEVRAAWPLSELACQAPMPVALIKCPHE